MFVAGPFYIRTAVAAFGDVDSTLTDAARTFGASPARTFGRIALPLAVSGLGAGRGALVRPRDRRVRGDDHVRRLASGRHPDTVPRRLRAVRRRLRHGARDWCRARGRECRSPPCRQAGSLMASLDVDLSHGLRDVRLELTLEVGSETVALVGPSGAGKSSVLRAVAGLVRPERGRICAARDALARYRRRRRRAARAPLGRPRLPGVRAVPAPLGESQRVVRGDACRPRRRGSGPAADHGARR